MISREEFNYSVEVLAKEFMPLGIDLQGVHYPDPDFPDSGRAFFVGTADTMACEFSKSSGWVELGDSFDFVVRMDDENWTLFPDSHPVVLKSTGDIDGMCSIVASKVSEIAEWILVKRQLIPGDPGPEWVNYSLIDSGE